MPRYYVHVKRDVLTVLDQESVALANIAQASEEASRRRKNIVARDGLLGIHPSAVVLVANESWWPSLEAVPEQDTAGHG